MGKLLNCSSRLMMIVMVLVFWFFSALLMLMGIKMLMLIGSVQAVIDNRILSLPAVVLILLSLLCLVIGIIGCAGASFESRKTQGVFFFLLLLILVLQGVGFFLCIGNREKLYKKMNETITDSVENKYIGKPDDPYTKSIDYIQETFKCCGANESSDWARSDWGKDHEGMVPGSCCKPSDSKGCKASEPVPYDPKTGHYNQGCARLLYGRVRAWLGWLIALAVIFVVVEVLALTCTCIRFKQTKRIRYQTLSEETAKGYRA